MEFAGITGNAVVTKNRVSPITLGIVTVKIFSAFEHQKQPIKELPEE
jgi:hypothetical protein